MPLFAALLIAWLVAQPLPPLQDYMDWAFQGWVGAQMLAGAPGIAAHYAPVHYPVPNAVSQIALSGLSAIVGPFAAAKVWMASLLAGFAVVCFLAARRFLGAKGAGWEQAALGLVLFLTWAAGSAFWDGYANYQLSLLLLFCWLLRRDRIGPPWIAILGAVLFACHAAAFLALGLFLLVDAALDRKRLPHLLAIAPAAALLVWYTLAKSDPVADQGAPPVLYGGLLHHLAYKVYTVTKAGPFHNLVDFADRSERDRSRWVYMAGIGLNVLFGGLLFTGLAWAAVQARRQRDPLLVTAAVLFVAFLLLPTKTLGVVNLGERLLYPALLMVVFAVRRIRFSPALAALGLCGIGLTMPQWFTMARATAGSPARLESTSNSAEYAERYGLYDSRLYQFDLYRAFLENPKVDQLPLVGFDTSIFLDRIRQP